MDNSEHPRALRTIAWFVTLVALALSAFALAVRLGDDPSSGRLVTLILTTLGYLTFSITGLVIVIRRERHPVGWLFVTAGLAWSLELTGAAYAGHQIDGGSPLPLNDLLIWMSNWLDTVGFGAAPLLVGLIFPTGRLINRRWRPWVALSIVAVAFGSLGAAFTPGPLEDTPQIENPYGLEGGLGSFFEVCLGLGWPLLGVALIAMCCALIVRFRTASGTERQQVKWMVLAGLLMGTGVALWPLALALDQEHVAESLSGIAMAPIPVAAGIAIVRHRLYDIDVVINRTLVYGALTAVLGAAYLVSVAALQRLLEPITQGSEIAVAGSTLATAALFRPARIRVQSFIDRRFYRAKYDAEATLKTFGTRMRSEVDLATVEDEIIGLVQTTMSPQNVSLWTAPASRPQ